MNVEEYLTNPCGTLSIPMWKTQNMIIPNSITIIHYKNWNNQYQEYQRYFRIKHDLKEIDLCTSNYEYVDIDRQSMELVNMINESYLHEKIILSLDELLQMKTHSTFKENLWICIKSEGRMVASGIAEYDEVCREGILEWIQVLPEYRGKGYGTKIVKALLYELKKIGADFVTVSGNIDNITAPLELYKKCGFIGDDIWYICR